MDHRGNQSTGLTTRQRDRRATRYLTAGVALITVAVSIFVHRHVLSSHPLEFWLPTVAGLTYGSVLWFLGSRRDSKWLSNLTMAGWLVVFWALLGTKVMSGPAWFMAVITGALTVTAAVPRTPAPSAVGKVHSSDIQPWTGSGLTAEFVEHDCRRHSMPAVSVITQSTTTKFLVTELASHFDRETGIAESVHGQPLMFLTRVGVASPDSIVGEATVGVPEGTLVLLPAARDDTRIAVVLHRGRRWSVRALGAHTPEG